MKGLDVDVVRFTCSRCANAEIAIPIWKIRDAQPKDIQCPLCEQVVCTKANVELLQEQLPNLYAVASAAEMAGVTISAAAQRIPDIEAMINSALADHDRDVLRNVSRL